MTIDDPTTTLIIHRTQHRDCSQLTPDAALMKESKLELNFSVPNRLEEESQDDLPVKLNIESLADFSPDRIAQQVPELQKLLELREALVALKGPLGNIPAFRNRLQDLLASEDAREQLLKELDLVKPAE